jgi:trimeric autotransporter adhesin
MTIQQVWCTYAELAQACYADGLTENGNNLPKLQETPQPGMSEFQAEQFLEHWKVLRQDTALDGFSATLFENLDTGERVLAIAGTHFGDFGPAPNDLLTDIVNIARFGSIAGMAQYRSLENFYEQLIAQEVLDATEQLSVTGHSLGGFLTQAFAARHPSVVTAAYTFNAPGFNGAEQQLKEFLGLAPGTSPEERITNVEALGGPSMTATLGTLLGSHDQVAIEVGFAPNNHGIAHLVASTAVQDILVRLDPNLSQTTLNLLVQAASATESAGLESLLDTIRRPLLGPVSATAVDANNESLLFNVGALPAHPAFASLEGKLRVALASQTLAVQALTQFSSFFALYALSPLVLTGANPTHQLALDATLGQANGALFAQWQADLSLTPQERAAGLANFSDEWIADRTAMLTLLVQANQANELEELDVVHSEGVARSYIDLTSGLQIDTGEGSSRQHIVFGGAGDDVLAGGGLADRLYGGFGGDSLNGGDSDDYLEGGGGNDTLTATAGRDVLSGGADFDVYNIGSAAGPVTIRDADGAGAIVIERADTTTYTLGSSDVREVAQSAGYYEDDEGNRYQVSGGDLIVALEDGRRITVEDFETMSGTRLGLSPELADPFAPPTGVPTYTVANPGEQRENQTEAQINADGHYGPGSVPARWTTAGYWYARHETEIVYAGEALEPIHGTPFVQVRGGFGDSYIFGDAGFNWILDDGALLNSTGQGGPLGEYGLAEQVGNDRIEAGAGADWILTRGGDDVVYAGEGDDFIDNTMSGLQQFIDGLAQYERGDLDWLATPTHTSNDRLFGEAGNDYINADGGNQLMDGGANNDELFAGAGDDALIGGDGNDVLGGDLYLESTPLLATLTGGFISNVVFDGNDLVGDLENYGDDVLDGGDGDDTMFGGGGADTLIGGAGTDRMQGDLRIGYQDLRQGLRNLAAEPEGIHGDDVMLGGAGNDEIDGGGGDDVIDGGADNDTIVGGMGDDIIEGGAGVDTILGDYTNLAQGDDWITGGDHNDTILGMGGDDDLYGDAGDDNITGGNGSGLDSGADWLEGGAGDDSLFGEDGNDTLHGGSGSDDLQGGDGDDTLIGSSGNDALFGEAGNDRFVLNRGVGPIQISDTAGVNTLEFGVGIAASDIRVVMADFTTYVYFSATDYASMSDATFQAIGLARFANGAELDADGLRDAFRPGEAALEQNITLGAGVTLGEVSFMRRNDDLLLVYSGAVSAWVNTSNFSIRNVIFEMASGEQFGLPASTQVLVLNNWHLAAGGYLNTLVAFGESPVNFVNAARAAPGIFEGGADGDPLIGTNGADTLRGGAGADILLGGAGNDVYVIAAGDGADAIVDADGGLDTVRFGAGIAVGDLVVTETNEGLSVQIGPAANGNALLIADGSYLSGQQQQPIERFEFDGGAVLDAAQMRALVTGNRRPELLGSLADQEVGLGQLLSYEVPAGLFNEPDGSQLTYSAALADGGALPSWLTFDPVSRTFTGSTSQAEGASFSVRVTARDPQGLGVSAVFTVTYSPDRIIGTTGNDTMIGSVGEDNLFGRDGDDLLEGRLGEDRLQGEGGNDRIVGGRGADRLEGGAGNDELEGGDGNDTYVFSSGFGHDTVRDVRRLSAGFGEEDRIEFTADSGVTLSSLVVARSGADLVIGVGADQLTIKDWYVGQARPIESFVMYAGGLRYSYSAVQIDALVTGANSIPVTTAPTPIVVGSGETIDYTVPLNAVFDTQSDTGVETLTYSINGTLPAWLSFDPVTRRLTGTVPTGAGPSVSIGVRGTDSAGASTVTSVNLLAYDNLNRQTGTASADTLNGGAGSDFILGGAGNDILNAAAGRNYVDGEAGNDVITGGAIDDRLFGGDGNDTINGLGGDDIIQGGAGDDTVTGGEWTTGEEIRGGDGADTIFGRGGADQLFGDSGADTIFGEQGTDSLQGGSGDDVLDGGGEADSLLGGEGNDILIGGIGSDQLQGSEGNDIYQGFSFGMGPDTITGTEGVDTVEFSWLSDIRISDVVISRTGSGTSGNLILTLSGSTLTMMTAFASSGESVVERYVLYYDDVPYTYTARQVEARANGLNALPEAILTFEPQTAAVGAAYSYVVPADAFTDIESQLSLMYSLTRADGSSLPAWLTFDPVTRTLSGAPTAGDIGVVGLRLTAQDAGAQTASTGLWINVGDVRTDGTAGADTVNGTAAGDALYGLEGNDNLVGNAGDDILHGGAGNDAIDGGTGADWAYGGAGDDTYSVDNALDVVKEDVDGGTDTVISSAGSVVLAANVENLTLTGAATGGTGNDLDNRLIGNAGANLLLGDEGNDIIEGGDDADDLRGGGGDDLLDGGLGGDTMRGGTGNDTYVVDSVLDTIIETGTGSDLVLSSVTYTLDATLEHVRLQGTAAINATGNSSPNTLVGNAGDNTLDGGGHVDTLIGGAGNDVYRVDSTGDTVTESENEGTDRVESSVTFTLAAHVENLTLINSSTVHGTGNALDNVITGNSAANTLTGHAGNDTLNGGSNSDTMVGGLGNDTYVVAQAGDVITELAGEGVDLVQASISHTLASHVENLTLTGTASTGTGNELDNVLMGNGSNNTLTGNDGNDTLDGGSGSDTMIGGLGNDTYVVAQTLDVVTEGAGGGVDTVQSSIAHTLAAEVENLTLTGSNAINGTGNGLNNTLMGNAGNNTLTGNAGNDTLSGGTGADIYSYSQGHGADTINNSSTDSALDRLNFTNIASTAVSFSRSGDDLLITRTAIPTDNVRVTNWFTTPGDQLDIVQFTDVQLSAAQVTAMVPPGLLAEETQLRFGPGSGLRGSLLRLIDAMNYFDADRHAVVELRRAEQRDLQPDWLTAAPIERTAHPAWREGSEIM